MAERLNGVQYLRCLMSHSVKPVLDPNIWVTKRLRLLKLKYQPAQPLTDIVVKLPANPSTFLFLRFQEPAAEIAQGFLCRFPLGVIRHVLLLTGE